ncbi:hypothetical protein NX021_11715 [Cytobacillus firmus]|nr:hypothetical protein [Cytobacillus firmus]
MEVSPNNAHLQTGEEEIRESESEQGSSSDRGRKNPWKRVRTRLIFGQEKKQSVRVSPNKAHLRTGEEEIQGNESEEGSSSDRRR